MNILYDVLAFVLGMCLCVQVLGALYGFIDLRHRISTAWGGVLGRTLLWLMVAAGAFSILSGEARTFFIRGTIAYVFLYVAIFGAYHLVFQRNAKTLKMK